MKLPVNRLKSEEPEDSQPNVKYPESGWRRDPSTVMPSQFGFSETSLF